MRRTRNVSTRGVCAVACLGAILLAVTPSLGMATPYQVHQAGPPPSPGLPPIDGSQPADPRDPTAPLREASRVRAVANERQKKIIDDTARLLQLATELKTDVDKTTKEEMSMDVIRKADEIERLAHDVKQRTKG
jgi:hypothetical protein